MTSSTEFFPIDSLEFLKNICPNYLIDEKLICLDWLGDKPLIITYWPDDFKDNCKGLLKLWKKNAMAWNYKTSKTFKFIVKPGNEITDDEMVNNSFLIYGLPNKIEDKIPIKIKDGRCIIGENSYEGDALQLSIVIPNPVNSSRFIAIAMTASDHFAGINLTEVGGYSLTRDNYMNYIEEGCLEYDTSGNAVGLKWKKQHPEDNNWLYTTSGNHIFCVRPDSHAQRDIKKLINIHETAYKNITRTLNIRYKKPEKIMCFINQKNTFRNYYKNNKIYTIYNDERKAQYEYAGAHELVHALMHKYFGFSTPLFDEGLAELLGSTFRRSIDFYTAELLYSNDLVPLTELLADDTFKSLPPTIAYMQSASFVQYLISHYGLRRFIHLYKVSAKCKSKTVAAFLPQIYNKPLVDMEKEWKAYIAAFLNKHRDEIVSVRPLWAAKRNLFRKDYPATLSYVEDCLRKSTNDPEVYWVAGNAHFFIGNLELSIETFLKALSFPSEEELGFVSRTSYLALGNIHDIMGERDVAVNYYNKVLACPEYDEAHDEARKFLHTPYIRQEGTGINKFVPHD